MGEKLTGNSKAGGIKPAELLIRSVSRCFISFNSEISSKVVQEGFGSRSWSYRAAVGEVCCLMATVPFLCPIAELR